MFSKVLTSMDVRQLLVIHRLNLFWSAKKHLATTGEPRAHILAPRMSFKLYIDKNTFVSNLSASAIEKLMVPRDSSFPILS